jgi:hypothetical protein
METLIFQPDNQEQVNALKAFAKALKISFKTQEKPYDPEFVAKIKKSKEDFAAGKGREITIDELDSLWK